MWRFEVTYQDGLDAGLSETEAAGELGVQTVTLDGGTFRWDWRSQRGEQTCEGTFHLEAGLLHFADEPRAVGCGWHARCATETR